MSLFSLFSPIHGRQASSLHRRFLNVTGLGGAVVILVLAAVVDQVLSHDADRQGDARVADAAGRASLVVSEALADRSRQARILARTPAVIAAAREGTARASALGIVGGSIPALEQRFNGPRSMEVSPLTRQFLRDLLPEMDAAEFLLTDANGYNAVTTQLSSDFVQSDEAWWQLAWRNGISPADAAYDSSARQVTVSVAALVHDGAAKLGVVKLAFSIAPLVRSLASAGAGVRIDVVDSVNRVVLSSDSATAGRRVHGMPRFGGDAGRATSVLLAGELYRVVGRLANEGRWRVVARMPVRELDEPFVTTRLAVVGGAALLLVVLALLLASMNAFLQRRISTPARELAEAAEAVAGGDFSVQLRRSSADDEMGRLSRAVDAMILELRRLAQAIAGSARETSTMSAEITAGSEEMAATAGEIANTASDLSNQSALMAETIASLAGAAGTLRDLAGALDSGAHDGVARNTVLRALALDNRVGLDASAESLRGLSDDIHASAAAVAALGSASEEIRSFVTLVRQLARQSKLLALNAAMEAARAGTQGAGFGVVALEVRRLASMSSDAAESTAAIVKGVLKGIDASRASAGRAVATADEVRASMAKASSSFTDIERAVADAEAWTASIEQTSVATSGLVVEMTQRLDSLSSGTESFAAAMQQVAASSQEQSASTQEIAGAANALGSAAERMTALVAGLKA